MTDDTQALIARVRGLLGAARSVGDPGWPDAEEYDDDQWLPEMGALLAAAPEALSALCDALERTEAERDRMLGQLCVSCAECARLATEPPKGGE